MTAPAAWRGREGGTSRPWPRTNGASCRPSSGLSGLNVAVAGRPPTDRPLKGDGTSWPDRATMSCGHTSSRKKHMCENIEVSPRPSGDSSSSYKVAARRCTVRSCAMTYEGEGNSRNYSSSSELHFDSSSLLPSLFFFFFPSPWSRQQLVIDDRRTAAASSTICKRSLRRPAGRSAGRSNWV